MQQLAVLTFKLDEVAGDIKEEIDVCRVVTLDIFCLTQPFECILILLISASITTLHILHFALYGSLLTGINQYLKSSIEHHLIRTGWWLHTALLGTLIITKIKIHLI